MVFLRPQVRRDCRMDTAVLLGSFAAVEPSAASGRWWPRRLLLRWRLGGAGGDRRRAVRWLSKGICRDFFVFSCFVRVLVALSPGQLCVWLLLVLAGVCVLCNRCCL
jgi:hypothetical protein